MKILTAMSVALAAFAMNAAIAQTPPASAPSTNQNEPTRHSPATTGMQRGTATQDFSRADSNRDGNVSRDELSKYNDSSMNFVTLDKNSDGNLTSVEWRNHTGYDEDMEDEGDDE